MRQIANGTHIKNDKKPVGPWGAWELRTIAQMTDHLAGMFGDGSVVRPEGAERPAHWPKHKLGFDFDKEWRKWQADTEGYKPPDAPSEKGDPA